jgi:hypothetical protein
MKPILVRSLAMLSVLSSASAAQSSECFNPATMVATDSTSEAAAITPPSLAAAIPNHGYLSARLIGITIQPRFLMAMSASGPSTVWLTGSLAPATYHIRLNFRVASGTGISSVVLHSGQLASSSVLVSCPVTNSVADVLLRWPGGAPSMLAEVEGSAWSYFSSISIVPTAAKF